MLLLFITCSDMSRHARSARAFHGDMARLCGVVVAYPSPITHAWDSPALVDTILLVTISLNKFPTVWKPLPADNDNPADMGGHNCSPV